ncbi:MAG TPA: FG-GAP-like repeat-containing protein [Candidatus Sulfotelmatobacter sp.]|nr:FG-GAP-like repeat-containing protein [Candidatus Sulfotelmatobacter sp.]
MILAAFSLFSADPQNQPKPNPIEAARLNNLGVAYMNQQLFEKGLKSFQQSSEADPKLAIARLNQGVAYLNLQKIDEAKTALEDALKQDAENPNAWYSLGLLAKNTGDAQASIDAFRRVTEIDANDADTWYFLGTAYVQAKNFPPAIDAFLHALQINPLHASAEFGLSRAYQQSADVEHAREHLKKFQYITQNKIGAPMSLAYGEQGQYSRAVESPSAVLKAPAPIKVRFVDVTKEAGISGKASSVPTDLGGFLGSGACFLDYDGDGHPDIFVANGGPEGGLGLYHNLGNGKFEDVTRKAGLDPSLHATGCTAGDYDNDGFVDLAIGFDGHVLLEHNERNGTFRNATESSGIKVEGLVLGLTFIDYDHDGDLDLYLGRLTHNPQLEMSGINFMPSVIPVANVMWRNNGDGTFTDVTEPLGLVGTGATAGAVGSDLNNDRAVDLVMAGGQMPTIFENPREGKFKPVQSWSGLMPSLTFGVAVLDFNHDGWMDLAFTHSGDACLSLWRNNHGKFESVSLPPTNWVHAWSVAAFDYDNDGWVDLVAVGETKEGKGEVRLFRNLGPDGFKDVTADVGLDRIHLESPRAIITGDYDSDGTTDLLITQNHGPAVLLRNEGANQNHWLRLALKGLNDNKSAIGTKVEVFSGGNRQKFEIYGSNGYLGQSSTDIVVGLGDSKEADIVRMLWPTGVLEDEIQVAGDKQQDYLELDRRGSSCPTLFVWNGERYEFVADMLGAGVVGHRIGPDQRDIPRPVEYIKIDRNMIREKESPRLAQAACHPERSEGSVQLPASCIDPSTGKTSPSQDDKAYGGFPKAESPKPEAGLLSLRFMEPLEEAVYLDQVRVLAVDHPANTDVYPNEYFASNPPYPPFKVVVSRDARPPAGAWDDHGHNVLPDLQAHRYFGDFALTQFQGFAKPHTLTLDLGAPYRGGPLWLLMHGEVEYFSANSMYAASQAGVTAISPYVEALVGNEKGTHSQWKCVTDDMGFPAGGPRTMTADLSGKLPLGTQKIRITTNLQVYWDNILVSRTEQHSRDQAQSPRVTSVPLAHADLRYHGYPLKIEGKPAGNVQYIYEKVSATGPYTRPTGTYTRYGDVLPLLTATDDKLAVFGSGDEVRLDFDPSHLPALPKGWARDYFFAANGYEKDMDFYAAEGNFVAPLPFLSMGEYPYAPKKSFPLDDAHVNYLLEYNTRHMSGNEQRGYWFDYGESR